MPYKISAVIIAYNEAEVIDKTLQALSWCNEIIVVDSWSTDNTVSICRERGCKIFHQKFLGYGPQKNFGIEQASNDWILSIDADEIVTQDLRDEILNHFTKEVNAAGFNIPRTMVFMGKQFKYGAESSKLHLRLFDKKQGRFSNAQVHEKVMIEGNVVSLKSPLLHYSYKDIFHYFQKFNLYTSKGAEQLFERGKKKGIISTVFRFPFTFIKIYFFQGCILNGFPGFVWSLFSAMSPVVKYVKLHELWTNKKRLK